MKKMWAGLAALGVLVAGCGASDGGTAAGSGGADTKAAYLKDCHNSIDMIVGYTAGGATDVWARVLADAMSKETGAKIQVVNAPGAGGSIGINKVISAKPDGCTIGNINLPSGLQYLFPNSSVKYTKDDMSLIGESGYSANAIAVSAKSPYKTLKDLLDDAKAKPGKVNAASDGPASDDAVAYTLLEQATGIKLNQVVLNGSADKVTSLLGGQIDFFGGSVTGVIPQLKNQQIRLLCVYADKQSQFAPDVPTCKSAGADVVSDNRWSLMTAKGVPEARRKVLEDALMKVSAQQSYKDANTKAGIEVVPLTGAQLSTEWDRQAAIYKTVTAKLG
jgi:tripartite-type tricarboxylate transporter receptor subunit TctC